MKVKVKLDAKTLQELLLQNVEKIGLGIVALIFLLMVYSAFNKVDRYERTPEQLIQAVQQGEETIKGTPPITDLKVQDYAARVERGRIPIKEKEYATVNRWDPEIFPKKRPRPAPPLLAAHKLRGKADVGAFQMVATPEEIAAGGANPIGGGMFPGWQRPAMTGSANEVRGQRWIVLTALVPIEKQELAFIEAFRNSKFFDPQNDVPRYLGYWIERVEVAGPSEAAKIDWKKAREIQSSKAMKEAMSKWAQSGGTEVVEQKYLHERLVFPLPPLIGNQWDENVAHPKEIPILSTGATGMGMGAGMGMGMPSGRGMMGDEFLGGMGRREGMGRGMGPGGLGRPGGMPNAEDDPFNTEKNNPLGPDTADAERIAEQNKPPSNLLLRFFDFNVEPGKCYVYRVRLGLYNPNRNLKPIYLANPKLAKQKWLETKWSDPSSVISVPRNTRVLAVSVSPGRANRDPTGRVMLAKWVQRRGFLAHDEFNVERGQTINFSDKKFRRVEDGNRMRGAMGAMMPPNPMGLEGLGGMPPGAGRTPPTRPRPRPGTGRPRPGAGRPRGMEDMPHPEMPFGEMGRMPTHMAAGTEWLVNYYSRAIAIDFRGGENLSGRRGSGLTSLGEILLLDADGNLVVHNELDDRPDRDKITAASEATLPAAGGAIGGTVPAMPKARGALDKLFQPGPTRKQPGRR